MNTIRRKYNYFPELNYICIIVSGQYYLLFKIEILEETIPFGRFFAVFVWTYQEFLFIFKSGSLKVYKKHNPRYTIGTQLYVT